MLPLAPSGFAVSPAGPAFRRMTAMGALPPEALESIAEDRRRKETLRTFEPAPPDMSLNGRMQAALRHIERGRWEQGVDRILTLLKTDGVAEDARRLLGEKAAFAIGELAAMGSPVASGLLSSLRGTGYAPDPGARAPSPAMQPALTL